MDEILSDPHCAAVMQGSLRYLSLSGRAELVRDRGVTTVFAEEGLPADLARTLAAEAGAASATLHTIESPAADLLAGGDDYFSLMRANLAALQDALGC